MGEVHHHHFIQSKVIQIRLRNKTQLMQIILFIYSHEDWLIKFSFIPDYGAEQIFNCGVNYFHQRNPVHARVEPLAKGFEKVVSRQVAEKCDNRKNDHETQAWVRQG